MPAKFTQEICLNNLEKVFLSQDFIVLKNSKTGRRYLTRHLNSETREKWCKVVYEVTVDEKRETFTCICGNFEHTGMLCCHSLKVWITLIHNQYCIFYGNKKTYNALTASHIL